MASQRMLAHDRMTMPSPEGYGDPYNYPPYLVTPLADQMGGAGQLFSMTIPDGCFTDADDDPINYTATLISGSALPTWLSFDAGTATFSGTPAPGNAGVLEIRVRASDGGPGGDSDTFALTILSGQIIGGDTGPNALVGTAYADSLSGGAGNDSLDGGAGADTLAGGPGDDSYTIDNAQDSALEQSAAGTDTVRSSITLTLSAPFENLHGIGSGAIALTGNAGANQVSGNGANNTLAGLAGADTVTGGGGADTLLGGKGADSLAGGSGNDTLAGGGGVDELLGGAGNDTYVVDGGDTIREAPDGGRDSVRSTLAWTLGANLENLTLAGSAVAGAGNALANALAGNAQANRLDGRAEDDTLRGNAGNDTLRGSAGMDTLVGGGGADSFVFDTRPQSGVNVDTLADFASGSDGIRLDDDVFAAFTPGVAIKAAQFAAGAGLDHASTAAQRLLYDTTSGTLYYDRDGSGAAAAVPLAVLGATNHPALAAADFLVIA